MDKVHCFVEDLQLNVWGERFILEDHQVPLLPYCPKSEEKNEFPRHLMLAIYGGRFGILRQPKIKGGLEKTQICCLNSQRKPNLFDKVTISKTMNDSFGFFMTERAERVGWDSSSIKARFNP